jgi:hypothetical protein
MMMSKNSEHEVSLQQTPSLYHYITCRESKRARALHALYLYIHYMGDSMYYVLLLYMMVVVTVYITTSPASTAPRGAKDGGVVVGYMR